MLRSSLSVFWDLNKPDCAIPIINSLSMLISTSFAPQRARLDGAWLLRRGRFAMQWCEGIIRGNNMLLALFSFGQSEKERQPFKDL